MQLYGGYPPYAEGAFEAPVMVDSYLGPEFFPFAPELGDLSLYLDDDIDVDLYFNKMQAYGPEVTLRIAEEVSEWDSGDEVSDKDEQPENDWEEEQPEHPIKAKSMRTKKKSTEHAESTDEHVEEDNES